MVNCLHESLLAQNKWRGLKRVALNITLMINCRRRTTSCASLVNSLVVDNSLLSKSLFTCCPWICDFSATSLYESKGRSVANPASEMAVMSTLPIICTENLLETRVDEEYAVIILGVLHDQDSVG